MKVEETKLPGVLLIEPDVYEDERGFFFETWNQKRYKEQRISSNFVQDNLSFSKRNVLRGLHFQSPNPQGKLVSVLQGEVFDVVVDLRTNSATFKEWLGIELSSTNKRQLYIPEGFAHGFVAMSETTVFFYKCSDFYNAKTELTLLWNDPEIGIEWPISDPVLSKKDSMGLRLEHIESERLLSKPNGLKEGLLMLKRIWKPGKIV